MIKPNTINYLLLEKIYDNIFIFFYIHYLKRKIEIS